MKFPPQAQKILIEASIEKPITIETDYAYTDEIGIGDEWRFRFGKNTRLNLQALRALLEKDILKIDSP